MYKLGKLQAVMFAASTLAAVGMMLLPQPPLRPVNTTGSTNTFEVRASPYYGAAIYSTQSSARCSQYASSSELLFGKAEPDPFDRVIVIDNVKYYPIHAVSGVRYAQTFTVTCDTADLYITSSRSPIVILAAICALVAIIMLISLASDYRDYARIKNKPEVATIPYDEFKKIMVDMIDISPAEIDQQKEQLVDKKGNVTIDRYDWFKNQYAARIAMVMNKKDDE